jgi:Na+-transporting NADH:ubiquinone oxidoreductase subunit NqrC
MKKTSVNEVVVYCESCKKFTRQIVDKVNHFLHLILTIITFGIWSFIWIYVAIWTFRYSECLKCGIRKKYISVK